MTGLVQAYGSKDVLGSGQSTLLVTGYTVNDGNGGKDYTVTSHTAPGTIAAAPDDFRGHRQQDLRRHDHLVADADGGNPV